MYTVWTWFKRREFKTMQEAHDWMDDHAKWYLMMICLSPKP